MVSTSCVYKLKRDKLHIPQEDTGESTLKELFLGYVTLLEAIMNNLFLNSRSFLKTSYQLKITSKEVDCITKPFNY